MFGHFYCPLLCQGAVAGAFRLVVKLKSESSIELWRMLRWVKTFTPSEPLRCQAIFFPKLQS